MAPRRAHYTATAPRSTQAPEKNRAGHTSWTRPLQEQYLQTLLTNTFGNTFYADARGLIGEAEAVHDAMLEEDATFAAKALIFARTKGYMRTQPIFGLAKLAGADTKLFEKIFPQVILTPNDLSDFTSILKMKRPGQQHAATTGQLKYMLKPWKPGSQGGRAVKRTAGNWMLNELNEYWAIKYGAEKDDGVYSLKDMLQVFHPDAGGKKLPLFDYIMGRTPVDENLKQIRWFEVLKKAQTDAVKVDAITSGRLPHEVSTSFAGKSVEVWSAIVPQLPIFALLKNLATLERNGVLDANREVIEKKLLDPETIKRSKILPFRFVEAIKHVNAAWAQDAIRGALELAVDNVLDIDGITDVALDRSGSMTDSEEKSIFFRTASVFAISVMKKSKLNGKLWLFNTGLEEVPVSMRDSILTQAGKFRASSGTDQSLVIARLLADKRKVDNLIYITDEQQNAGIPVIDYVDRYRQFNPDVNLFIIDVSPYREAMTPDDPRTWYIYGWSDQVLNFISLAEKGFGSMTEMVDKQEIGSRAD